MSVSDTIFNPTDSNPTTTTQPHILPTPPTRTTSFLATRPDLLDLVPRTVSIPDVLRVSEPDFSRGQEFIRVPDGSGPGTVFDDRPISVQNPLFVLRIRRKQPLLIRRKNRDQPTWLEANRANGSSFLGATNLFGSPPHPHLGRAKRKRADELRGECDEEG